MTHLRRKVGTSSSPASEVVFPSAEVGMLAYALKRLGLAVLVAIAVSALAFLLLRASGDIAVALAGEGARVEDIENIRRVYGLDRPLVAQYLEWLAHMVRGDFGESLYFKTDVLNLVRDKLPTTGYLAFFSMLFALGISIPLGVVAALYPNSAIDRLCLALAVVGQALPTFFLALILLLVRAGMIDVLASDYIRTARAMGLSGTSIVLKHALRNALVPVVALAAVQLGFLLGGSVVIETVFALDGLGYLAYQSIAHMDLPVTQAIVTLLAFAYVGLTLAADLVNGWLDPRIRMG